MNCEFVSRCFLTQSYTEEIQSFAEFFFNLCAILWVFENLCVKKIPQSLNQLIFWIAHQEQIQTNQFRFHNRNVCR
jgi:hypothetical protein